jgi:hypothetical protein
MKIKVAEGTLIGQAFRIANSENGGEKLGIYEWV